MADDRSLPTETPSSVDSAPVAPAASEGNLVVPPATPAATTNGGATNGGASNGVISGGVGEAQAARQALTGGMARSAQALGTPQASLSPAQLTWRQLRKNKLAVAGGVVLFFLYTIALLAPFLAPYSPEDQTPGGTSSSVAFHPPMKLRWREANGRWHKRPFIYGTRQEFSELRELIYRPDPQRPQLVRFFVPGHPYKLFGLIPTRTHLFGVPQGGAVYLLGTDEFGRDYFSRLLYGSQISLSVGLVAIAITFTLGMLVGGISGFYGGRIDDIIMRVCEVMMSVPDFYLLLALAAALPFDLPPVTVYLLIIVILSFVGWAGMARVIRGMVLSVREREYVEAARALGVSDLKTVVRHILPATFTYAIVAATASIPGYILAEAGLSFLGLGIRDPVPSWGNMLTAAQTLSTLETRGWILAPGLMIFITTLAFNFLGDGLRDALDPKSRRLG